MRPCALPHRYGRKREKRGMRPCFLLICTAANGKRAKCGRATFLANTAANGKRQRCGRAFRSSIRPQKEIRRNAAVRPTLPIRPKMKKDRAAAVRFAHLLDRSSAASDVYKRQPPHQYGRKWKKTELRPCISLIDTAANREKAECGRATLLANTAANGKRQSCGRAPCLAPRCSF